MTAGPHHSLLIRAHLDQIDSPGRSIGAIEDEIAAALEAVPAAWGVSAAGEPSPDPGPGAAVLPAGARLAEIPGVSLDLARAIIAETGLDMGVFPTAGHLVSWAGLAPVARQSGPRSRKPGKGQGNAFLKNHCSQAANGAGKTGTFLGARFRRLNGRIGGRQDPLRRRKVHPHHRLAPAEGPRRPLPRPRRRLARPQGQPRQEDPRPPPPAPGPRHRHQRPIRHPQPRRLKPNRL